MYAVAQAAMHGGVQHHCRCGRRNTYTGQFMLIGRLPERVARAAYNFEAGHERLMWQALLYAAMRGDLRVDIYL